MSEKRMRKREIIKLGGSLIEIGRDIIQVLRVCAEKKDITILLIPGGGPFAEVVRTVSVEESLTEEAAHWMAVFAMHQYGLFLANDELPVVESLDGIEGHLCIIQPYQILKADDCLPHTWDVTSDTIAAFVANKIGEKTFIKLTDVDGIMNEKGHLIERIHVKEMFKKEKKGCVDAELPGFLMQNKMSCTIVNGNFPSRIIDVIEEKETICTKLF